MSRLRRGLLTIAGMALVVFLFTPATASACAKCYYDPGCYCWRCSFALFTTCSVDFFDCVEETCGGLAADSIGQNAGAPKLACGQLPKMQQREVQRLEPVRVLAVKRLPERT